VNKTEILSALAEGPKQQVFHYREYGDTRYAVVLGMTTETVPKRYSWEKETTKNMVRILPLVPINTRGKMEIMELAERTIAPRQIEFATGESRDEWVTARLRLMAERNRRTAVAADEGATLLALLNELGVTTSGAWEIESKLTINPTQYGRLIAVLTDAKVVAQIKNTLSTTDPR